MSMIDKKIEFIQGLSKKAPKGCDLKVNQLVEWVNDYGVKFQHRILGFDYEGEYANKYNKHVILDKESYWFPHSHLELKLVK